MEAAGGDRWKGGAGKRRRLVVVVIEYMCKPPECVHSVRSQCRLVLRFITHS